jgi:CHAT domain-containing protein
MLDEKSVHERAARSSAVRGRLWVAAFLTCSLLPACPTLATEADPATRIDRAHAQLLLAQRTADPRLCRELKVEFERDPPQDWSVMAFRVWAGLGGCEARPGGDWARTPPGADDIRQAWRLTLGHFDRMPTELRLKNDLTVDIRLHYWAVLRGFGSPSLAAVADAEEASVLDDWHRRAAQKPPDPLAVASLTRLGAAVYGMRWLAAWMQVQQQRLEATLGPGHEATLHMLRSRVFAARAHERPAEALALSDDYAARLARSRPHDERLAMLNRSERIGALAGVGRAADALDEGRLLLAWLQARQPAQPGNVMRTAYNLASVALGMGDADAAEAFARLSVESGDHANNHDRAEAVVGRWLGLQARLQRGDDSAGPPLKALLQDAVAVSMDLPAIDPVHTLHQWALRAGDAEAERWAAEVIERASIEASTSLQGARALPWLLRAEAAPPGSAEARQAAAMALVHGLAADGAAQQVRPTLALARQVAPQQPAGAAWLCKRAALALVGWRQGQPVPQAGEPRPGLLAHDAALRHCIGLFIDQGRLGEAEQLLGVLREEELHEFRRRSRGAAASAPSTPAIGLTPDERSRDDRVTALQVQLRQEATAARARADAQPDQRQRRGGFDAGAEAVAREAAQALQTWSLQPPPGPRAGPAGPASGRRTATLALGQARITYLMPPEAGGQVTALVEHAGRRRRLVLPVASTDLSRGVAELRAQLATAGGDHVPAAAQRLHGWLVAPLMPVLAGARQLSIVPDGVLRYLPFAALHDGRRYLVERYGLSLQLAPDAGAAAAPARANMRPRVVAFGRSQPSARHSALPGVADELAALRGVSGADVQLALDQRFTRDRLQDALQQRPQVVHLASHFVLSPASEEDSYLLLGDDVQLSLRELRQLPWRGVELAVLSACDSALPLDLQAVGPGREWAGFAAALQRAGVKEVMATLWRIDDASVAPLMKTFYAQWSRRGRAGLPGVSLLARTQRLWLQRHGGGPLAHPRHWAGFVWIEPTTTLASAR